MNRGCGTYLIVCIFFPALVGWILEQAMMFVFGTPFSFVCNHGWYRDGVWERYYTGKGNPEQAYHFETWFGNYEESFIAFILIVIMHLIYFNSKPKCTSI